MDFEVWIFVQGTMGRNGSWTIQPGVMDLDLDLEENLKSRL